MKRSVSIISVSITFILLLIASKKTTVVHAHPHSTSSVVCSDSERTSLVTLSGLPQCVKIGVVAAPSSLRRKRRRQERRQTSFSFESPTNNQSNSWRFYQSPLPDRIWDYIQLNYLNTAILEAANATSKFQIDELPISSYANAFLSSTSAATTTPSVVDSSEVFAEYDQLVEMVSNGTYDFLVGDFLMTGRRALKVGFFHPFLSDRLSLLYQKTGAATSESQRNKQGGVSDDSSDEVRWSDFADFLQPMRWSVWLVALGLVFIIGILSILGPHTHKSLLCILLVLVAFLFSYFIASLSSAYFRKHDSQEKSVGSLLTSPMLVPSYLFENGFASAFTNEKQIVASSLPTGGAQDLLSSASTSGSSLLTTQTDAQGWSRTHCDFAYHSASEFGGATLNFGFIHRSYADAPTLAKTIQIINSALLSMQSNHLLANWIQSGLPQDQCSPEQYSATDGLRVVELRDLWSFFLCIAILLALVLVYGLVYPVVFPTSGRGSNKKEHSLNADEEEDISDEEAMRRIRAMCEPSPIESDNGRSMWLQPGDSSNSIGSNNRSAATTVAPRQHQNPQAPPSQSTSPANTRNAPVQPSSQVAAAAVSVDVEEISEEGEAGANERVAAEENSQKEEERVSNREAVEEMKRRSRAAKALFYAEEAKEVMRWSVRRDFRQNQPQGAEDEEEEEEEEEDEETEDDAEEDAEFSPTEQEPSQQPRGGTFSPRTRPPVNRPPASATASAAPSDSVPPRLSTASSRYLAPAASPSPAGGDNRREYFNPLPEPGTLSIYNNNPAVPVSSSSPSRNQPSRSRRNLSPTSSEVRAN